MTLNIDIHGKVAVYRDTARIVTDNTDYTIAFDFGDSNFTVAGTKYLVCITDAGKYDPIPFTGSTCDLPAFTDADGASVKIGIYEGDLQTTTPAEILITPSILGIEAGDAEPSESGNVPVIDDPDDISDDDEMIILPSGGVKSHVAIAILKAIFGSTDSNWALQDGALVPSTDVNMDGQEISNVAAIYFDAERAALPYRTLSTAPTSATAGNTHELIWCSADLHWYVCAGANRDTTYTWRKLIYGDDDGGSVYARRTATYTFTNIPYNTDVTLSELMARLSGWYDKIVVGLPFYVDVGTFNTSDTGTPWRDILNAYDAGRTLYAKYGTDIYRFIGFTYSGADRTSAKFVNLRRSGSSTWTAAFVTKLDSESWTSGYNDLATASSVSEKQDKIVTVTVADAGAVTQALDAGKIYNFTGALTALTVTLTAAALGKQAHYHFTFTEGSTAFTPALPNGVVLPDGHTWEADTRYEVDILDGYAVICGWEVTT